MEDNFLERAKLAKDIYGYLFEETETFEKVGISLAYLMGAILENFKFQVTTLAEEDMINLLRKEYPADHLIWNFILC